MLDKDQSAGVKLPRGTRVIIVIGPLELGGAERQAILLAQYLAHVQGADVQVWGYGKPGRAAELCEEHGIAWRSLPLPIPWSISRLKQLKRLVAFARALRQARPDVILPYMFMFSVPSALVWRFTGARVCIWNQRCEGRDRLGHLTERLAVRLTRTFVANSEHGAEFLTRELGVPPHRLHVIHNGVRLEDHTAQRSDWRSQLGIDEDCIVACMVANLQQFKDHVTLLKAWRIVIDRLASINRKGLLLLAGRFDETHDSLKALAFDLNLGQGVRFLGPVKDVSRLLSAVDIGVHSSVNEGCPNGVLECMAAGLPIVGTDYPGIREAVGEGGLQFLAPAGDAEALADQIFNLALDPKTRQESGAANRMRIMREFRPEKMYSKMLALILKDLQRAVPSEMESTGAPTSTRDSSRQVFDTPRLPKPLVQSGEQK